MRSSETRKLNMFETAKVFIDESAADFASVAPYAANSAKLADVIAKMREAAAAQISGESTARQSTGDKSELIDDLWQMIRNINRAANAFEDEIPTAADKFRLPRNRSQQNLTASARAIITDAQPLKANFIEYGLQDDFLEELQQLVDDIEQSKTQTAAGSGQRAESTEALIEQAREGMNIIRRFDSIIRIKYQNNAQKLAAWTVASHLDRAPRRNGDQKRSKQPA